MGFGGLAPSRELTQIGLWLSIVLISSSFALSIHNEEGIQSARDIKWTAEDLLHPDLPHLHHDLALSLCSTMNQSWVPHKYRYLWTKIVLDAEQGSATTDDRGSGSGSETQNMDGHVKVTSGCIKYTWRSCVGKPRFPLPATCGFFDVVPLPPNQCHGEKGAKSKEVKSSILIDHARALELCLAANGVFQSSGKAAAVKYIPVRIDVEPETSQYLSLYCLGWRYTPCAGNSDPNTCGVWRKEPQIQNTKCLPFLMAWESTYNISMISDSGNQKALDITSLTMDFIQEEKSEDDTETASPELGILRDLVFCTRKTTDSRTTCRILPKSKGVRSKRETGLSTDVTNTQVSEGGSNLILRRTKRYCCNIMYCAPCGGRRYLGHGFGYAPYYFRQVTCECGLLCPEDCTENWNHGTNPKSCGNFCGHGSD